MTAIYLAARFRRRKELCGYADELRALGHSITSRWLTGAHRDLAVANLARYGEEDAEDIRAADCLIAFTEPATSAIASKGGAHVELGLALGLGKAIIVIGHRQNV